VGALSSSDEGRHLWRHNRKEISKGKPTHLAAPVAKGEVPLVLLDLAHLDHMGGAAASGMGRGDDPLRIRIEGSFTETILNDGFHYVLPSWIVRSGYEITSQ
jgi:hypothetical protein